MFTLINADEDETLLGRGNMNRTGEEVLAKINLALKRGRGTTLSVMELMALANLLNEQSERALSHETMLHTFVQRAYGQNSFMVH